MAPFLGDPRSKIPPYSEGCLTKGCVQSHTSESFDHKHTQSHPSRNLEETRR
jgi:hypothetical protein